MVGGLVTERASLAIAEGLPALITDQAWAKLQVPGLTVTMAQ